MSAGCQKVNFSVTDLLRISHRSSDVKCFR